MENSVNAAMGRRRVLSALACGGVVLSLPGCSTVAAWSLTDAVKRILTLSSQNAFARLTAPGGFWDSAVARIDLPAQFPGNSLASAVLTSAPVRRELQKTLNTAAESGAERAAPLVYEAIRNISIADAAGIVRGGNTAATAFLRREMGSTLIGAMVPALGDAMRAANNPLLAQAISAISGVDLGGIAQSLSVDVDNAIWAQMGLAETEIRQNPESTNDPLLIAVLKAS